MKDIGTSVYLHEGDDRYKKENNIYSIGIIFYELLIVRQHINNNCQCNNSC